MTPQEKQDWLVALFVLLVFAGGVMLGPLVVRLLVWVTR